MKILQNLNQQSYKGRLTEPHLAKKSYKAKKFLRTILDTEINGLTNRQLIQKAKFNVEISCPHPNKTAINPKLQIYATSEASKSNLGFYGIIRLKQNDDSSNQKFRQFLEQFEKELELNKDKKSPSTMEAFSRFLYGNLTNSKH